MQFVITIVEVLIYFNVVEDSMTTSLLIANRENSVSANSVSAGSVEANSVSAVPVSVVVEAADHVRLASTYYPCANCCAAILICSAPGIGQRSYAEFAGWLNNEGFAVLTFDYRGIGDNLFKMPIKSSKAKLHEWGQLDMVAELAHLADRHPDIPLYVVAHDIAGMLMGLMPNNALIRGAVCIGGTTFYVPNMARGRRFVANLFFKFYIPLCLLLFGYVPLKVFGGREDIPADVAKQWAHWSLHPGHIRSSFGADIKRHFYREFRSPISVIAINGKRVIGKASETNFESMLELYRSAAVEHTKVAPRKYGFEKINHTDFFKPAYANLWPIISDWLKSPERRKTGTPAPQAETKRVPVIWLPVHAQARIEMHLGGHPTTFIGPSSNKAKVKARR